MRNYIAFGSLVYLLIACGAEAPTVESLETQSSAVVGWESQALNPAVESAHPYANDTTIERRFEAPEGALAVRVMLTIQTEAGYDFVEFLDGDKNVVSRFAGKGEGLTPEIAGRVMFVRLVSDRSVTDWGFSVTALQFKIDRGSPTPPPATGGQWVTASAGPIKVGSPYDNNMDEVFRIQASSRATKIRLHFTGFETEQGYDFARIFDASDRLVAEYTGKKGDFVGAEISGNVAKLRFVSDYSVTGPGFTVSRYEAFIPGTSTPPGCSRNSDCQSGEQCISRVCRPRATTPRAEEGAACDSRSAPCVTGLSCRPEQGSALGGVCVEPKWSREALAFPVSTDHPYKNDSNLTYSIEGPEWAEQIRVVLSDFATEDGYDQVELLDGTRVVQRHTGKLNDLVTAAVDGNRASVRLTSDYSVTDYGFDATEVDVLGAPDTLVAVSLDLRRCESSRIPTNKAGMATRLAQDGVTLYGFRKYRYSSNTCAACSCPSGERMVMLVHAKDAEAVTGLTRNTGIFSVQRNDVVNDGDLVRLTATPAQCGGTAWDRFCQRSSCGATVAARVKRWAESLGVSVLAAHPSLARQVVCEACSCPERYDVSVLVPTSQAARLEQNGFQR